MKNYKNYDELEQLTHLDDKIVEKIAEYSPILNKEAIRRIEKKCERKMNMKKDNINLTENYDTVSGVEKSNRPAWYRPVMASAACLLLVTCGTGIFFIKNKVGEPEKTFSDVSLSEVSISSQISENENVTTSTDSKNNVLIVTSTVTQHEFQNSSVNSEVYNSDTSVTQNDSTADYEPETYTTENDSAYSETDKNAEYDNKSNPMDNDTCNDIAQPLLGSLNYIDQIGGCYIPRDEENTFEYNGVVYEKVAKTQFQNTSDLRYFMRCALTDRLISERYSNILDSDVPLYIDVDGALYGRNNPVGCGFNFTGQTDFYDITENSFMVSAAYDDYGAESFMKLKIVNENGAWKIDSISF